MTSFFLICFIGLLGAFGVWFLLPYWGRRRAEAHLAKVCRTQKAIVLSYDDGPGDSVTPRLLDLLTQQNTTATFFVLGRNAEERPETVGRLLDAGHEVGSHTFDHTNAWKALPHKAQADWQKGAAVVDRLGGQGTLFRPPYGKLTLAGLWSARRVGVRLGWWTLDSRDSWQRRPAKAVIDDLRATEGGVVLMHDGDGYDKSGSGHAEYVLDLTEQIIRFAHDNGYRLMSLGDLMKSEASAHG